MITSPVLSESAVFRGGPECTTIGRCRRRGPQHEESAFTEVFGEFEEDLARLTLQDTFRGWQRHCPESER